MATFKRIRGQSSPEYAEYSPQREENYKKRQENRRKRAAGEQVYDRVKDTKSLKAAEFYRWRKEQSQQAYDRRKEQVKNLSDKHKQQQQYISQQKEQQIKQKQVELKERHRPFWAAMYQEQRIQRQELENSQASMLGRLQYFIKHHDRFAGSPTRLSVRGLLSNAFKAITSSKKAFADLEQKHAEQKKYLSDRANTAVRNDLKKINAEHDSKLDQLIIKQREERAATKEAHSRESKQRAKDLVSGKAQDDFEKLSERQKAFLDVAKKPAPDIEADKKKARAEKIKCRRAAFLETKKDITHDTKAEQKAKEDKEKQEVRAARVAELKADMKATKEDITHDKPTKTKKKEDKQKDDYRVLRDDKGRKDDRGRDKDEGRKRDPKKPPTPPKNDM